MFPYFLNLKKLMKEAIIAWIDKVKSTLAQRRLNMPTGLKAHQAFIQDIEAQEQSLENFKESVDKLDESIKPSFSASLFVLFIDSVVPVFRAWRSRFSKISEKGQANLSSHQNALSEFIPLKLSMIEWLALLNQQGAFYPVTDPERPAMSILQAYDKVRFLESHTLQSQGQDADDTKDNSHQSAPLRNTK